MCAILKVLMHKAKQSANGFTIVELLIVIVVIAILAAVTLVAYNGITKQAQIALLQSDLSNGSSTLGTYQAVNGTYPNSPSSAGLKASSGDILTYAVNGDATAWCLQATGWNMTYVLSNTSGAPAPGYCAGASQGSGNAPIVSTFLGDGTWGYQDGTGNATRFTGVIGLSMGPSNTLYVTDPDSNCIRKSTLAGTVSTFAGTCVPDDATTVGATNGTGAAAKFAYPWQIATDSLGYSYVADNWNNCIRVISPSAVVTSLAGTCSQAANNYGYAEGTGTAAQFKWVGGLAVDSSRNVYVADYANYCVRKITQAGVVSPFAGVCTSQGSSTGAALSSKFSFLGGLAVDASGAVYIADQGNRCIRKVASGVVSTFAGTCGTFGYADGTGTNAKFGYPTALALDATGNLYVADMGGQCIRKITPSAVVSTLAGACNAVESSWGSAGGYVDGPASAAKFQNPQGITIDSSGNLYVADTGNQVIRKITQP